MSTLSFSPTPAPQALSPISDPALTAQTFVRNPRLAAALARIQARAAQRQQPSIPLAEIPVGASPVTVRCPVCNKWARQDGLRFFHLELKDLATGIRDDARSLWCDARERGLINGAEADGSDALDNNPNHRPTEDELNEHYLLVNGWESRRDKWYDAVLDQTVPFAYALGMQAARDFRDAVAEKRALEN